MRGFIIVLALIGLVAGGGWAVRTYAPQYLPDEWTTDEVLLVRLRAEIVEDPYASAFITKFEQLFPADNTELMTRLVALYRDGGSADQARTLTESYMRSFVEDNKRHVANAGASELTALLAALSETTRLLRTENPELCAQMFRSNAAPPLEGLSNETKAALVGVTTAMLDSIASGMRAPTQHPPPSQAQAIAWMRRFEASGGDVRVIEAFGSSDMYGLSSSAVCDAASLMWTSALSAEDDFAARFVSLSYRQQP